MKYLVLGAGGMAGHMITIYLKEQGEEVVGVARRPLPFCETIIMDVTKFVDLKFLIYDREYDIVINCVGILNKNADSCPDRAVLLNAYLPHYLAAITKNTKTKIIHMSTDCVFSGKKGHYTEISVPDGETVYDKSKALGELIDHKNLTFRNSIIGPDINYDGIGLFNWFMKQKNDIYGYEKSIWTGVTTLVLAKAIHKASYSNLIGLYNLVNNQTINKFELVKLFIKYSNNCLELHKVDGIICDKSLQCTRRDFDFVIPSYEKMIKDMMEWISQHQDIYQHYNKQE